MSTRPAWEAGAVLVTAALLTVCLTYPLAFNLGTVGRVNTGDGMFSIWNVAWVARTLVTDPAGVADANIFSPHRGALFFSEANLGAGALAVPAYWASGANPYFAHNFVVLVAFALSAIGMYALVRYLTGHRGAAAVSAVVFAFCPYVFARLPHIQLLMVAPLPIALLAWHVFVDRLTSGAALSLALALVAVALCCGYYAVFAALIMGLAAVYFALARGLWKRPRYWLLAGFAGALAAALVFPVLQPYLQLRGEDNGAFRTLDDSAMHAADYRAYLVAAGWGNGWIRNALHFVPPYEVLFPGFVTLALVLAGAWLGVRAWRTRGVATVPVPNGAAADGPRLRGHAGGALVGFYVLLALLALWLSFGPRGGLYVLFYRFVPLFTLMRAPARFGLVVTMALAVLAGMTVASLGRRGGGWRWLAPAAVLAALAELAPIPIAFPNALEVAPAYRVLAHLPRGPVAEFPFFWREAGFHRHTYYMLNSTYHWQPLINGYSDHNPPDFYDIVPPLSTFPSRAGFEVLRQRHARYVVFHLNFYNRPNKEQLFDGLGRYEEYLRPLVREGNTWLYQIVAFPK